MQDGPFGSPSQAEGAIALRRLYLESSRGREGTKYFLSDLNRHIKPAAVSVFAHPDSDTEMG